LAEERLREYLRRSTHNSLRYCPIRLYKFFRVRGELDNEDRLMRIFEGCNLIATF